MRDPVETAREEGRTTLTEAESKRLLTGAGVETPAFEVADTPAAAVEAAERVGYPVVVKVSSPAVTHKSEWAGGAGVAVGLASETEVREAATRILDAAADRGIDADVLVEEAADVDAGTETIVGGLRDPAFGPVVLVGLGGVFTEIFEDTAHRIAPVSEAEARDAIRELTATPLLEGYRGRQPGDVDALASVVATVGDVVAESPAIAEVDVNPVLVDADGAVALDALVVLTDDETDADSGGANAGDDR